MIKKSTKRKLRRLFLFLLVTVAVIGIFWAVMFKLNRFELVAEIRGEEKITLDYSGEYIEQGAIPLLKGSLFFKEGITPTEKLDIIGKVDSSKVGDYSVKYSCGFLWWQAVSERTVSVVDEKPPVIQLHQLINHKTVYGMPYEEEGFDALDEYDGDISHKVKSEEKDGKVVYTVSDSSGNVTVAEREIDYIYPDDPVLTLKGSQEISLSAGTKYEELGFTALDYFGNDISDWVQVSGEVDHNNVGTYVIEYVATDALGNSTSLVRVVNVEPLPPAIILLGKSEEICYKGQPYKESGFNASDYFGNDISDKVTVSGGVDVNNPGTYVIEYSVTDSYGKTAVVKRTVYVQLETEAPVISLSGEALMKTYIGWGFEEPGYHATAYGDEDVTGQVVITGAVDGNAVGSYTLTYSFTDKFGRVATATRVVEVYEKPQQNVIQNEGKTIYLTFDDGPCAYTMDLLDILDKYDVKATFFVVDTGEYDIMREIVNRGHSIGIHSMTHKYNEIYASSEAFMNDLYGMQSIIYEETGVLTNLMRFPGGSSNTVSSFNKGIMTTLAVAVEQAGFQYFDWNVSSGDAGGAYNSTQVYNNVIYGVDGRKNSIVLQHDNKKFSVNAVEDIIIWGLENGYTFKALDENSPKSHHGINN